MLAILFSIICKQIFTMKNLLATGFLLLTMIVWALVACQPNAANSATDKNEVTNFCRSYKGTIGDKAITLKLAKYPNGNINGFYSFDQDGEPIWIQGEVDSAGQWQFFEHLIGSEQGDVTWTVRPTAQKLVGTWRDTVHKKTLSIALTQQTSVTQLEMVYASDTIQLFKGKKNSPIAKIEQTLLMPVGIADASLATFLKNQIYKQLRGDTIEKPYPYNNLREFMTEETQNYFKNYRDELADETFSDSTDEDGGAFLNYENSSQMSVIANNSRYLSLAHLDYSYTGGAHGNYGTAFYTLDLKNRKRLTLNDVFKAGFEATLDKAIDKKVRQQLSISPEESLEGHLLIEKIEHNDNFALTEKGILFNYVPYEIASYAQGEIQIFVPFSELKTVLK